MTTRYSQLALLLLTLMLPAGCASAPQATTTRTTIDFELVGDEVSVGFTNLPLDRFLELAQRVTEDAYACDRSLIEATKPFSVIGRVQSTRAEFGQFVQTMLYTRGLVLEPDGEGPERCLAVRRITNGA